MEAIILDMDGVMVDSVEHWNGVRERVIREELGVPDVDVSELVGMNAHDEYDYLAREHDLRQSKEAYVEHIRSHAETIYLEHVSLLPGLERVFDAATRNGFLLGLVSASYRRRVEMVLDRFNLSDTFDAVVAGDDLAGPSKPDPAIYDHATSLLDVGADECVAVEDSEHGVAAATAAGVYCLGYACHPGQPLSDADERFKDPSAVIERLQTISRNRSISAS